jgi:hypothetical protein
LRDACGPEGDHDVGPSEKCVPRPENCSSPKGERVHRLGGRVHRADGRVGPLDPSRDRSNETTDRFVCFTDRSLKTKNALAESADAPDNVKGAFLQSLDPFVASSNAVLAQRRAPATSAEPRIR